MPALVLFKQRTPFAGDDLRFFSLVASLFRLLQLCLGIALLVYISKRVPSSALEECIEYGDFSPLAAHGRTMGYVYFSTTVALSLFGLVAVAPMFAISSRGTPTDPEPRKALFLLCYFNLSVVNVFRVLGFLFGVVSVLVLTQYCECLSGEIDGDVDTIQELRDACPQNDVWIGLMLTLVVTHFIDFVTSIGVLFYFCSSVSLQYTVPILSPESKLKFCMRCCIGCSSFLTCCMFGGVRAIGGDISDFALAVTNLFNSDQILDVTASDVFAGLAVIRRVQLQESVALSERLKKEISRDYLLEGHGTKEPDMKMRSNSFSHTREDESETTTRRHELKRKRSISDPETLATGDKVPATREALSPQHTRDVYCVAEGARFMPLALAMYSWVIFLFENPLFGVCGLGYRVACFPISSDDKIAGDYFWKPHTAALKAISGLDEDDIVYASFWQSIKKTPYMISLDHDWKSIIISIRGTLSMESLLADIALMPVELTTLGDECGFHGKDKYCHAGMLTCTEWIYRDIKR